MALGLVGKETQGGQEASKPAGATRGMIFIAANRRVHRVNLGSICRTAHKLATSAVRLRHIA